MKWSEDRVALLRELWLDGKSAAQIAQTLGGATRNSVMGKVHRLKLGPRTTTHRPVARPARTPARRSAPVQRLAPRLPVLSAEELEAPIAHLNPRVFAGGKVATVLTLTTAMCKFPIGDPSEDSFAFCGRTACHRGYCIHHARVVFKAS
ncbi:MAG: GcrA cell cycle regulator [Hyphomonadaceae bacterium]|nr:GcrA cell cycle regulator [Hyphomonadaceae bacterium]